MQITLTYGRASSNTPDARFRLIPAECEGLASITVTKHDGGQKTVRAITRDGVRFTPPLDVYMDGGTTAGKVKQPITVQAPLIIPMAAPAAPASTTDAPGFSPDQLAKIQQLVAAGII